MHLHRAAAAGQINAARFLLEDCGVPASAPDEKGTTALHAATQAGHLQMVQMLVSEFAADPQLKRKVRYPLL